jgi:hypothetical protein
MARQPYLPTYSKLDAWSIGFDALDRKPEFAKIIALIIARWSYVDHNMGSLLAILLGTPSAAAMEVFLSLRRSSAQREALQAAAKVTLSGNELVAFEALMILYKSLESQRNDLAHGCFGDSEKLEDAIFWVELKHHVQTNTKAIASELRGELGSGLTT